MSEDSFQSLNTKVDQLIDLCTEMKRENQALKSSERHWQEERQALLEKNLQTKSKLQSILDRLKTMDQS